MTEADRTVFMMQLSQVNITAEETQRLKACHNMDAPRGKALEKMMQVMMKEMAGSQ